MSLKLQHGPVLILAVLAAGTIGYILGAAAGAPDYVARVIAYVVSLGLACSFAYSHGKLRGRLEGERSGIRNGIDLCRDLNSVRLADDGSDHILKTDAGISRLPKKVDKLF